MKAILYPIMALFLGTLSNALGAYGFFQFGGSYVILDVNHGWSSYYYLSPNMSGNPNFDGRDFGTFNTTSDTFVLNGFEFNTYESGSDNVMSGALRYRVYEQSSAPPVFLNLAHTTWYNLGGGNERHETTAANVNLLAGLTPGNYYIEVYGIAEADWNNGGGSPDDSFYPDITSSPDSTRYASAAESPFVFRASMTVIPEPSAVALAVAGAAVLWSRRRRAVSFA